MNKFENALREADSIQHPFLASSFDRASLASKPRLSGERRPLRILHEDEELSLEEEKRREAEEQGKKFRVPDWWMGEDKAYKMGKAQAAGLNSLGNFA